MLEVKFYDTVDDDLLKFAVIISQSNGKAPSPQPSCSERRNRTEASSLEVRLLVASV